MEISFHYVDNFNERNMTKKKIIKEAKRIQEDSIYSSKGHFNTSEFWSNFNLLLGSLGILVSAVISASSRLEVENGLIISGVLALFVACITAVLTFINPNKRSEEHRKSGNLYNALKNDARIFYEIELLNLSIDKAVIELKLLNSRRSQLNLESPQVPTFFFMKARKGIEDGESNYGVDD